MKIQRLLSKRIMDDGRAEVILRLSVTMNDKYRVKSGVLVDAKHFRNGQIAYPRSNQIKAGELREAEQRLIEIEARLIDYAIAHKGNLTSKALQQAISPAVEQTSDAELCATFADWIEQSDCPKRRKHTLMSILRALHRFSLYTNTTYMLNNIDASWLYAFDDFYCNEHTICQTHPKIYEQYPAEMRPQHKTHLPKERGDNFVNATFKALRSFFLWANEQELCNSQPFAKFKMRAERYGTPYYLTIDERNRLADYDFADRPKLAVQRDVFIFQCLVGCRVSDLVRLTKDNIIGNILEYMPQKTAERGDVVRVPLGERALTIIARYAGQKQLLPTISPQRYNDAIKEMLRLAGIDRLVTKIDPVSGKDVRKPIWEVASSHIARRTFIGNLYKLVKDPNLIGSMSGHKDASKSFARYRAIDDEIKAETVKLIE